MNDQKEKLELVNAILNKLLAVYSTEKEVNNLFREFWWEALKGYSVGEITAAYNRFKQEYQGSFLPKPPQFMEFRFCTKNYQLKIAEAKDLDEQIGKEIPMPNGFKDKYLQKMKAIGKK